MSVVATRVSEVRLGARQSHLNLRLFPLLADGPRLPGYRLLDEALALGCVCITH